MKVHWDVAGTHAYVRFNERPSEAIRERMGFDWEYCPNYGHFRTARDSWPILRTELEAVGVVFEAEAGGLLMTRRDVAAKTKAAGLKAQETTLAGFDWSGFPEWALVNLVIKDKISSRFVPFKINPMQRRLFEACLDQWRRTGRVRMNVLKHRQPGFSTLIQGLVFYLAWAVPGTEALVTAHRDDAADAVFRRTKIYEQRLPEQLRRPTDRNNRKEIQWTDPHSSALRVSTASEEGLGRGDTRHIYHASEPAHYATNGVGAKSNIEASVPDAAGTLIWRETTANGLNHFYEDWQTATLAGYENFFVGWLEDETCRLESVRLDDERWERLPAEWREDEARLRAVGADDAQIAWRRWAIASKCHGLPDLFMQEFPATSLEAFISTGSHVFPLSVVDGEYRRAAEAERVLPARRYRIEEGRCIEDLRGNLRVWKEPDPGIPYLIAGDIGRGINVSGETGDPAKLDYTTFRVIKQWADQSGRHEEVACWHGRADPDRAAGEMATLGKRYNTALLVPEANHYGVILINFLLKLHGYPSGKVFKKESVDRGTRNPVLQEPETNFMRYGWWTGPGSGVTKAVMIEYLNELVRDRALIIHEPEAWEEMRTFMRAADGSMDAESGKHDDRVMALAIAACILKLHPKRELIEPKGEASVAVKGVSATAIELKINFGSLIESSRVARRGDRDEMT